MRPSHPATSGALPRHGDGRRTTVGLLGGSFNPAHDGHLHVARTALRRLGLDQVWLLVSPGNPLKSGAGMSPLARRLASAGAIADGRRILATDIERHLGTRYTLDTLRALRRRFPRVRFVWLMGADNLRQFPHWRGWMRIARIIPFAVLPRPTYTRVALASHAARRLASSRLPASRAPVLAGLKAPAWMLLVARENTVSATALRRAAEGGSPSPESPPRPPAPAPTNPKGACQRSPPP